MPRQRTERVPQGDVHHLDHLELPVFARHDALLCRTDRQDRRLRWVDHSAEMLRAVHARIESEIPKTCA
jgi:hypothetical protein